MDGAILSPAQVSTILRGGSGVSSSSNLLSNLVQQLLAADLNVLRGAQPTTAVVQAMANANAGVQIVSGPPILLTSALSTSAMSTLVNTLTAFNEGKLVLLPSPTTTSIAITEKADALTELSSIVCAPSAACSGIYLTARTATATTTSGQTTTVSFTNRGKPVLRICKVAGAGVTYGTVYRFTAGGVNIADAAQADVAAGDCEDVELLEATYMLTESVPAGEAVQSIVCAPAAACSSFSVSVGVVHVAVARGLTTVTYTNRSIIGTLHICKVAGPGIALNSQFQFTAGGINITDSESYGVGAGGCQGKPITEGNYQLIPSVRPGISRADSRKQNARPGDGTGVRCGSPHTLDKHFHASGRDAAESSAGRHLNVTTVA